MVHQLNTLITNILTSEYEM